MTNGSHYKHSILSKIIPRKILFSEPIKYPKISPNGKILSYLSPVDNVMQFYIKTLGKDDDRCITKFKKGRIYYYIWATDKYIIYLQNTKKNEHWLLYKLNIENYEITKLVSEQNYKVGFLHCDREFFPDELILSINMDNMPCADLYRINLNSNTLTLVEKNPGNVTNWFINNHFIPVGKLSVNDNGETELLVRDHNEWKTILVWNVEERILSRPISFTKDNKYIYVADTRNFNTSRIIKIEIKTGKTELIAFNNEYDVYANLFNSSVKSYDPFSAIINSDTFEIVINPETFELQAVAFYKFQKEWIIIDKRIEEYFEAIRKLDRGDFSIVSRDDANEIWIIAFEKDNGPVSYYSFNRELKKGTFIFYNNPVLNDYNLSPVEEVTFKSRDNLTIHGYITYPVGVKREKLPLVLSVHPGPWYRDIWEYNPYVQWISNRGYICLQINYRGSIGYGKDFMNAGDKEWGGRMQDDLVDGVKWAIEKGIADPAKIAIYGSGYGGYAAIAGATFTPDLFCCAVAVQCIADILTYIQSIPQSWQIRKNVFIEKVGNPENDRELLIKRSPFYSLEQIKIPILISYSFNSSRIKSLEPYRIVQTIKSKGIAVEHIVFPDEGHEISKQENRLKFYAVTEKFFSKHLGGGYEAQKIYMKDIYISPSFNDRFYEKTIIDKILYEGDNCAFEQLIEAYKKPLLKHLFNLTGDHELSNELLLQTFYRVWLYLSSYSFFNHTPFISWLFKIATNVVNDDRIKKSKISNEIRLEELNANIMIGRYKENIENKIFISSLINSLNEPYKTSMFLRFIKEFNYKEIASLMNTDENNVKIYLYRAKKCLQKLLQDH